MRLDRFLARPPLSGALMTTPPPSASASGRGFRSKTALLLGVLVLVGAGVVWALSNREPKPEPETVAPPSFPLTPVSSSPHLNTGPDARYIGSAACRKCHPERHDSFRRSGMGRSMAEVDLAREPADATYEHGKSKRRYEVARKDGQMWHRELLASAASPDVVLAEYPVKYVIG